MVLHKSNGSRIYSTCNVFLFPFRWGLGDSRRCRASQSTFTTVSHDVSTAASQLQAALMLWKVNTSYSCTIHANYSRHPSYRRFRGLLPELSMVLQSSSLSGPAFGPRVAAMEPPSAPPPPPPPPLPTLKLSPPLSTNCKDS